MSYATPFPPPRLLIITMNCSTSLSQPTFGRSGIICATTLYPASLAMVKDSVTARTVWPLQRRCYNNVVYIFFLNTKLYMWHLHIIVWWISRDYVIRLTGDTNLFVSLATSSYTLCTPISKRVHPYFNISLKHINKM